MTSRHVREPRDEGGEQLGLISGHNDASGHLAQPEMSGGAHWGAASEGLEVEADPLWPPWRRAQRLSYALAAVFTDVSGQRALSTATSTTACVACLMQG